MHRPPYLLVTGHLLCINNFVLCFIESNFLAIMFLGSLAPQGPENILLRRFALLVVVVFTIVPPWEVSPEKY
jgi:hypothetical protein